MLREAEVLGPSKNPCEDSFIPDAEGKNYVMYMKMELETDTFTWTELSNVDWEGETEGKKWRCRDTGT